MTVRVVAIPCGGNSVRWGNHLGIKHKALIELGGETLAERIVRLARECCPDATIYLLSKVPSIQAPGALTAATETHGRPCSVDKLTCSRNKWSQRGETAIIFGDVFLSEEAARTILLEPLAASVQWFGRQTPNPYSGKERSELYAVRFDPTGAEHLTNHCESVREDFHAKRRLHSDGWDVLASMRADNTFLHLLGPIVQIRDRTEDFDLPSDLADWLALSDPPPASQQPPSRAQPDPSPQPPTR